MLLVIRQGSFRNGGRIMIIDDLAPSPLPRDRSGFLDRFRTDLYACLSRRADALFELTDAVACAPAPVMDLARLSLEVEHRRGHGGLYDGLQAGVIDTDRLRALACSTPLAEGARSAGARADRAGCGCVELAAARRSDQRRPGRSATPMPAVPDRPR